jgi:hypothetical protein
VSGLAAACDTNLTPQTIELGIADHPPSAGVTDGDQWQSVGWLGDLWLRYPGRSTIVMEHALGRMPTSVLVYLSFDEDGAGSALTAGDTARVVSVDDRFVTIRNDTDADFFIRIVLR